MIADALLGIMMLLSLVVLGELLILATVLFMCLPGFLYASFMRWKLAKRGVEKEEIRRQFPVASYLEFFSDLYTTFREERKKWEETHKK